MAQIDPNTVQWDAPPQPVGKPVTGAKDQPLQGGVILPGKPEKPEKPTETFRPATQQEKIAAGADPNRAYQINEVTKELKDLPGQAPAKAAPATDPNRVMKINSALDALANIRQLAEKSLSVGETAGRIRETPLIGAVLGQNRADLEGALSLVEGNLIQDQLAALAQINPGGIASLANAESEARRLASSIANLDPNQSLPQFLAGVQRAEEYYKRQLEQVGGQRTKQPSTTGADQGPSVTVTPEESIATFGQLAYDSNGNLVGRAYQQAGGEIFDAQGQSLGLTGAVSEEVLQQPAKPFYEGVLGAITGADQATATTERLPDWVQMPGINDLLSSAAWKTGLGTAFGGSPQEIAQIVQANFPGTQVWQDEKGNYILRSAVDGKDYAIRPGFQISDIPRAGNIIGLGLLGGGGAGATALQTAGREALMQTGIEAAQAGTGGTFNPSDIAAAAVLGGGIQKGAEVLPGAAGRMVGRMMGGTPVTPPAAAAGGDFVRELPRGIPLPGGRVSAGPAAAVPEAAPVAPMAAPATGGMAAPEPSVAPSVGGMGGTRGSAGAMSTSEEAIRTQRAMELPVPIELARFQRTRDFVEQQRARELAKNNEVGGPIRDRMAQQQEALRQNFDRFIDGTGSQVWENPYEQGGVIADALGTLAKRERTRIKALYKRAENAGEMREPVSYQQLTDFINSQTPTTREKLAPVLTAVEQQLKANDPAGTGMITLKQMEDVRKLINKVANPNTPDATFGKDMKDIIDESTQASGGDVYQSARAARAKYARDFEDIDLVQKVFANKPGTTDRYVALEKVVDRITGNNTPLDSVNHLLGLLDRAGPRGERAKRELQGALMEKIRDQAYKGITRDETGNVVIQPAALNTMITQLDKGGKLDAIFDRKTADLLRTINDVAKDVATAPPGSINPSGTSSAMLNAVDTLATFGFTGMPVPAGKLLNQFRQALKNRELRKEVNRLLD